MKQYIEIRSNYEEVDAAVKRMAGSLKKSDKISDKLLFYIQFTLRELLNNSAEHGNKLDINKKIICNIEVNDSKLLIEVADEGDGFVIDDVVSKNKDKDLVPIRTRGIETLEKLGFDIITKDNIVKATLDLNKINERLNKEC